MTAPRSRGPALIAVAVIVALLVGLAGWGVSLLLDHQGRVAERREAFQDLKRQLDSVFDEEIERAITESGIQIGGRSSGSGSGYGGDVFTWNSECTAFDDQGQPAVSLELELVWGMRGRPEATLSQRTGRLNGIIIPRVQAKIADMGVRFMIAEASKGT